MGWGVWCCACKDCQQEFADKRRTLSWRVLTKQGDMMKLSERQQILSWCLFRVILPVIELSFHILQLIEHALKIFSYSHGDEGSKVL
jgi:hypothetical protein